MSVMAQRHTNFDPDRDGQTDFTKTAWSMVIAAGHRSSPGSEAALESLCNTYWYPLYAYARRRVADVNEAQDLTQAFFATLLEKDYVGQAAPERGRFRSFLLTSFQHFLSKEWQKAKAQKRGGGRAPIRLDFSEVNSRWRHEPQSQLTADQFYERQWAITLLEAVMDRLSTEMAQAGKAENFELLKDFMIGQHGELAYEDVATRLGTTAAAAKMAASRMRGRYRQLLRDEIAQTVAGPEEVDDEIRELFETLGS